MSAASLSLGDGMDTSPSTPPEAAQGSNKADSPKYAKFLDLTVPDEKLDTVQVKGAKRQHEIDPITHYCTRCHHSERYILEHDDGCIEHNATDSKPSTANYMHVVEGSECCLNGHPVVEKTTDNTPWHCAEPGCEYSLPSVRTSKNQDFETTPRGADSLPELLNKYVANYNLDVLGLRESGQATLISKIEAIITKATARADREGRIDALNKAKQFNKTVYGESIDGMLETYFDDCIAELSLLVDPKQGGLEEHSDDI